MRCRHITIDTPRRFPSIREMKAAIELLETSLASAQFNEARLRASGERVRADKERDRASDFKEALWRLGVEEELPKVSEFKAPIPSSMFDELG